MSEHSVPEVHRRLLALLNSYGIRQADLVQRLDVSIVPVIWFSGQRAIPTAYIGTVGAAALARMAIVSSAMDGGPRDLDTLHSRPAAAVRKRRTRDLLINRGTSSCCGIGRRIQHLHRQCDNHSRCSGGLWAGS
jgi:hypothetical protein